MTVEQQQSSRRRELAATDDARAQRTRHRLVAALTAIMAEGSSISVAEVCRRAEVGRSTFYTHFTTTDDVTKFAVDAMFDELAPRDVARRGDPGRSRIGITRQGLREQIAALRAIRPLVLTPGAASERVRQRVVTTMASALHGTILTELPTASPRFVDSAAQYIAAGTAGVLLDWLRDPRALAEEDVIAHVERLLPAWLTTDGRVGSVPD